MYFCYSGNVIQESYRDISFCAQVYQSYNRLVAVCGVLHNCCIYKSQLHITIYTVEVFKLVKFFFLSNISTRWCLFLPEVSLRIIQRSISLNIHKHYCNRKAGTCFIDSLHIIPYVYQMYWTWALICIRTRTTQFEPLNWYRINGYLK